jgi:hypothetical protein
LQFFALSVRVVHLIAQQPQVDVVQRKGQHHANPFNARCNFHGAALIGQSITQRVVELLF